MATSARCICGHSMRVWSHPQVEKDILDAFWKDHSGKGHGPMPVKKKRKICRIRS